MKKYITILLLSSFFSVKSYAQDTTCTQDTIPPVISCPGDIEVLTEPYSCEAAVTWEPPLATDNCDIIISCSHHPGDIFSWGTTTVTYVAIDSSGNEAECSFDVTVVDGTPPLELNCPAYIETPLDTSGCGAVATWEPPIYSHDCDGWWLDCNYYSGVYFPVGTTTVNCFVIDLSGNTVECSFDVTVIDNEPPELTCPGDIEVSSEHYTCAAVATWEPPVVTDNCDSTIVVSNFFPGEWFPLGTTTVVYIATDSSGNTAECSFDVTVVYNSQPLNLTCQGDIEVPITSYDCDAIVDWDFPTYNASDCETVVVGCNYDWGDPFPVGTTTVTCAGMDGSGNIEYCSFDVTVFYDTEVPMYPQDTVVSPDPNTCNAIVTWEDPFGVCNPFTICSPSSGSTFPVGTTTVFCVNNNVGTDGFYGFDVTVTDECFASCPSTINLNNVTVNGLYHAENSVTTTNTTTSGSDVNFKAGGVIELKNGFAAFPNTNFSAEIEDCVSDFGAGTGENN